MTMITPSYLGETIEYSSLHACRSTLEDPTWGNTWLDGLGLPQPYAGKVASLRALAAELTAEITVLEAVIADLLACHDGLALLPRRGRRRLPGWRPQAASVMSLPVAGF